MDNNISIISAAGVNALALGEDKRIKVRSNNFTTLKSYKVTPVVENTIKFETPKVEMPTFEPAPTVAVEQHVEHKTVEAAPEAKIEGFKHITTPENMGNLAENIRKMAAISDPDTYRGKVLLYAVSRIEDYDKSINDVKTKIAEENVTLSKLEAAKNIEDRDARSVKSIIEAVPEGAYKELETHKDRNDDDPIALANTELATIVASLNNIKAIKETVGLKIAQINEKCDAVKMKIAKYDTQTNNLIQSKNDMCKKVLTTELQAADELDKVVKTRAEEAKRHAEQDRKLELTIEMLEGRLGTLEQLKTLEKEEVSKEEDPFLKYRDEDETRHGRAA